MSVGSGFGGVGGTGISLNVSVKSCSPNIEVEPSWLAYALITNSYFPVLECSVHETLPFWSIEIQSGSGEPSFVSIFHVTSCNVVPTGFTVAIYGSVEPDLFISEVIDGPLPPEIVILATSAYLTFNLIVLLGLDTACCPLSILPTLVATTWNA